MDFFTSPTFRRLVVTLATAALVALNRRLGLGMEAADVAALAGLAAAYVAQSAAKSIAEAKAAGELAASRVETKADAVAVLAGEAKP